MQSLKQETTDFYLQRKTVIIIWDTFRRHQSAKKNNQYVDQRRKRRQSGMIMSHIMITSDLFEITELLHHGPENIAISLIKIVGARIPDRLSSI